MTKHFKKFISLVAIIILLFVQVVPVRAFDVPTAPTSPSTPSTPTVEPSTQAPPVAPTPPSAPDTPTIEETPSSTPTPAPTPPSQNSTTSNNSIQTSNPSQSTTSAQSSASPTNGTTNGAVGDTTIKTGNTTNSGTLTTLGNSNTSASGTGGSGVGASVINSGNGTSSTNSGSAIIVNDNNTAQTNSASVGNSLNENSTTGKNSASQNLGSSTITSGDANTIGTILTGVNTNISGVSVSEFTVADDHRGDIVLDFGANCVSGCGGNTLAKNSGNGSSSQNTSTASAVTNNNSFQTNDATLGNNLTLASDSGNNKTSQNTGGDSTIKTGNANVDANVLTFLNDNLSGNVLFGVVNIFGNLIGDIILPDSVLNNQCNCGGSNATVANTNNGANSQNTASATQTSNNTTVQLNDAAIENNVLLSTTSGNNQTNQNTGGANFIQTGDASADVNVLNVANSNVDGGVWWLVIVNQAGQWVGKILGAPDGALFAGSAGTEFNINDKGEITAINNGNGAGSQNTSSVSQTSNNTTVQSNDAKVVNNLNLAANTGGNEASQNTGGDSTIKSGDAKIVANLVNFVNNNIAHGAKLVVTMVNVFGSWIGDFVTPGTKKEIKSNTVAKSSQPSQNQSNIGGGNASNNNENNAQETSSSQNSASSNNSSNHNSTTNSGGNSPLSQPQLSTVKNAPVKKDALVASLSFDGGALLTTKKDPQQKSIRINLAWALLILPFIPLLTLTRRVIRRQETHEVSS